MAKQRKAKEHLSRTEINSVRLLFLAALGVSGFLAWNSLTGGGVPGCGPESDCDQVLASKWAYVLGVPVSLFAMPVYLLGLIFTLPKPIPWRSLLPIAILIVVSAVWFIGLQVFAIRAFCKFCMAAHCAGIIAAILIVRRNPLASGERRVAVGTAVTFGLILAVAQMVSPAPTPKQVRTMEPSGETNRSLNANASASLQQAQTNMVDPMFPIVRGQFTLDLRTLPVQGALSAPKRMVKLFDYTCHHCRDLHHLLEPVGRKYSNELAIVSLPMPLNASCNPMVRSTARAHIDACEYARLALAVFYADRSKFQEFSDWLYLPERPPEVSKAKEHAALLVGGERLEAALGDARVDGQIRTNAFIYAASSRLGKSSALPQLIFQNGASIGAVADEAQLEKILHDALELGAPQTNQAAASARSDR